MENKENFLNRINIKNTLEYRYKELTENYRQLLKNILLKNNVEIEDSEYMFNELNMLFVLYPDKSEIIEEVKNIYYGDILLTENSLKYLDELYQKLHKIVE